MIKISTPIMIPSRRPIFGDTYLIIAFRKIDFN